LKQLHLFNGEAAPKQRKLTRKRIERTARLLLQNKRTEREPKHHTIPFFGGMPQHPFSLECACVACQLKSKYRRRQQIRRKEDRRQSDSPMYSVYPILNMRGRQYGCCLDKRQKDRRVLKLFSDYKVGAIEAMKIKGIPTTMTEGRKKLRFDPRPRYHEPATIRGPLVDHAPRGRGRVLGLEHVSKDNWIVFDCDKL
jgi:hypothetical protein